MKHHLLPLVWFFISIISFANEYSIQINSPSQGEEFEDNFIEISGDFSLPSRVDHKNISILVDNLKAKIEGDNFGVENYKLQHKGVNVITVNMFEEIKIKKHSKWVTKTELVATSKVKVELIYDLNPVAHFKILDRKNAKANEPIRFDASESRDRGKNGSISKYHWNFGDGQKQVVTQAMIEHIYSFEASKKGKVFHISLVVEDNKGNLSKIKKKSLFVRKNTVANILPVANFSYTPVQVIEEETISFTSLATDADGTIASYRWTFAGTDISNEINPVYTFSGPGTTTVSLSVTDNQGGQAEVTKQIEVIKKNALPIISSLKYLPENTGIVTGAQIMFSADASDSDGQIVSAEFDMGNGTSIQGELINGNYQGQYLYTIAGSYNVAFKVLDDQGGEATRILPINVLENQPPIVVNFLCSPDQTTIGNSIQCGGLFSDPDGSVEEIIYNWGDGQIDGQGTEPLSSLAHTYGQTGNYLVEVVVKDNAGGIFTTNYNVSIVSNSNQSPIMFNLSCSPDTVTYCSVFSFDNDGSVDSLIWNMGDGTIITQTSEGNFYWQINHEYLASGSYIVTATAIDDKGAETSNSISLDIQRNLPPVIADINCGQGPFEANAEINCAASFSDEDGEVVEAIWDFGDGNIFGAGEIPAFNQTHTYGYNGYYQLALRVKDDKGSEAIKVKQILIGPEGVYADCSISRPQILECSVNGDFSHSYSWYFGDDKTGTGRSVIHVYHDNLPYTVSLVVKNSQGEYVKTVKIDMQPMPIDSSDLNHTPEAIYNVQSVYGFVNETFSFDGSLSSDFENNSELNFTWDLGDGSRYGGMFIDHAYTTPGTYVVRLVVQDQDGKASEYSKEIIVGKNILSVIEADVVEGVIPLAVNFDGSKSISINPILKYSWSFGDEGIDQGDIASHLYTIPGVYTVALLVEDGVGNSNVKTITINALPGDLSFYSTPRKFAIVGQEYRYFAIAKSLDKTLPVTYRINNAPDGMTINNITGEVRWVPSEGAVVNNSFSIIATNEVVSTVQEVSLQLISPRVISTKVISSQDGGVIQIENSGTILDGTKFEFPAGAVDQDTEISVAILDDQGTHVLEFDSDLPKLTPTFMLLPMMSFNKPVTMTSLIKESDLPEGVDGYNLAIDQVETRGNIGNTALNDMFDEIFDLARKGLIKLIDTRHDIFGQTFEATSRFCVGNPATLKVLKSKTWTDKENHPTVKIGFYNTLIYDAEATTVAQILDEIRPKFHDGSWYSYNRVLDKQEEEIPLKVMFTPQLSTHMDGISARAYVDNERSDTIFINVNAINWNDPDDIRNLLLHEYTHIAQLNEFGCADSQQSLKWPSQIFISMLESTAVLTEMNHGNSKEYVARKRFENFFQIDKWITYPTTFPLTYMLNSLSNVDRRELKKIKYNNYTFFDYFQTGLGINYRADDMWKEASRYYVNVGSVNPEEMAVLFLDTYLTQKGVKLENVLLDYLHYLLDVNDSSKLSSIDLIEKYMNPLNQYDHDKHSFFSTTQTSGVFNDTLYPMTGKSYYYHNLNKFKDFNPHLVFKVIPLGNTSSNARVQLWKCENETNNCVHFEGQYKTPFDVAPTIGSSYSMVINLKELDSSMFNDNKYFIAINIINPDLNIGSSYPGDNYINTEVGIRMKGCKDENGNTQWGYIFPHPYPFPRDVIITPDGPVVEDPLPGGFVSDSVKIEGFNLFITYPAQVCDNVTLKETKTSEPTWDDSSLGSVHLSISGNTIIRNDSIIQDSFVINSLIENSEFIDSACSDMIINNNSLISGSDLSHSDITNSTIRNSRVNTDRPNYEIVTEGRNKITNGVLLENVDLFLTNVTNGAQVMGSTFEQRYGVSGIARSQIDGPNTIIKGFDVIWGSIMPNNTHIEFTQNFITTLIWGPFYNYSGERLDGLVVADINPNGPYSAHYFQNIMMSGENTIINSDIKANYAYGDGGYDINATLVITGTNSIENSYINARVINNLQASSSYLDSRSVSNVNMNHSYLIGVGFMNQNYVNVIRIPCTTYWIEEECRP